MEGGDPIESFTSITGTDEGTAIMYLEMAGMNLETAIQLFFGGMGDGGMGGFGGGDSMGGGDSGAGGGEEDWVKVVFDDGNIPDSWREQGLRFVKGGVEEGEKGEALKGWEGLSLPQKKNGPCGALCAFHATLLASLYEQKRLKKGAEVSEKDIYNTLSIILRRIAFRTDPSSPIIKFCAWDGENYNTNQKPNIYEVDIRGMSNPDLPGGGSCEEMKEDPLFSAMEKYLPQYLNDGGVLLLIYSAVQTRGHKQVIKDIKASGGEPYLVMKPFGICTSALLNLLLVGFAEDNMSAYNISGNKVDWGMKSKVGLLSGMEKELKIRINDTLKFPLLPIYILHGRDHFTVAFSPENSQMEIDSEKEKEEKKETLSLVHYNALPPNGPKFSSVFISHSGSVEAAPEKASDGIGIEYKPTLNSIDSIIQAHSKDKEERPKQWKSWRYEVALVIPDPTNVSPEMPADMKRPKTFTLPEDNQDAAMKGGQFTWRCRACYETRFKTFCFGLNECDSSLSINDRFCRFCGKPMKETGWTMWLEYDQLGKWQRQADRDYGPKINELLRAKWTDCEVKFGDEANPPVV